MKKHILVLLAISRYVMTTSAQTNPSDWVTSLAADSAGVIYAGMYSNGDGIFISTDGGTHWQHTKMLHGVTSMTLAKSNTLVAFAYGSSFGNYLFRLTNHGSQLDSMVLGFTPAYITSSPAGSLYATTYNRGIFESTDNGSHWKSVTGGLDSSLILPPIAITESGTVLVAMKSGIAYSTDNGQKWFRSFGIMDSASVKHIVGSTDGKIYAVAYDAMGVNAYEIYVSSDTGKTWSILNVKKPAIDAVAADSGVGLYAGGIDGVHRISVKGDTAFLGLGGIVVNGRGVTSLMTYGKNAIFAGATGGVYKSTDEGKNWEFFNDGMVMDTSKGDFTNPLPFGYYISCGLIDENGNYFAGTDSAGVFRSIDGGKTWVQTGLNVPRVRAIAMGTLGTLFAGTLKDGLFMSLDKGGSWTPLTISVTGRSFFSLCAQAHKIIWLGVEHTQHLVHVGTDKGLFLLLEDGDYNIVPTGDLANDTARTVTVSSSGDGVASTAAGQVYVSPGGTEEWVQKSNVGERVESIVAIDSVRIFAVGPNGVFRSDDKAKSWTQLNSGISDTNLISVAVDKAGDVFTGSYNNGDIYESTDQGVSWKKFATLGYPVRSLFIDAAGYLYATAASRLFRSQERVASVAQTSNGLPKGFSVEQNYPNPFNPSTTITYHLSTASIVKLTVFDILGREVATLVNESQKAGAHTITFDGARRSSGIYFYQLQAGSYRAVKKMVLMK